MIKDNGSQKNFVSEDLVKKLGLVTTPHPQPYNIGWMKDGQELRITRQCKLTYFIKPFEDEVLCDVAPLFVDDTLFGKPYLWDQHGSYKVMASKGDCQNLESMVWQSERQPTPLVAIISAKKMKKLINYA